jgi:hypothetical protein
VKVYYDEGRTYDRARLHPYPAGPEGANGFIDFKEDLSLIEATLEDFLPYSHEAAIKTSYSFLAWINGPSSHLETCDCVFREPRPHSDPNSSLKLSAHGRVFLMYRDLRVNCSEKHTDWFCGKLMQILRQTDPEMTGAQGVCGFTLNPVLHVEISKGHWAKSGEFDYAEDDPGLGRHLMISFAAYGEAESETYGNLERLFKNLHAACGTLSGEIDQGLRSQGAI